MISAFPFTPTQFTKEKERGSPSILSESSLFSSQMSYADDEDVVIKKSRNGRKRSNYHSDKRKKSVVRNNVSDDNHIENNNNDKNDVNYGNDDKNDHNEKDERSGRNERRASIVSKDDDEVKL